MLITDPLRVNAVVVLPTVGVVEVKVPSESVVPLIEVVAPVIVVFCSVLPIVVLVAVEVPIERVVALSTVAVVIPDEAVIPNE
jgi:hypothetical protein